MRETLNIKSETQPKLLTLFVYFALAMINLLVFWQVRHFEFVNFDDTLYVYENPHVLDGLAPKGILWAFTTGHDANWFPVTWLSLMLDCQLLGPNPGRIHLVNLGLHLINTLLLFWVLKKMTGVLWPSAFVAALFAVHPMHVESVAWISERKDVLSTLFFLLTLGAYAGYAKQPAIFRYLTALALFALGLMAKPMLVTLPFILLLLDYWPLNRFDVFGPVKKSGRQNYQSAPAGGSYSTLRRLIIEKIPFFALVVVSSIVTFLVQQSGGAMKNMEIFSAKVRLFNAVAAYLEYIKKMFWPRNLTIFYPLDMSVGIPWWWFGLCVLLLGAVTLLVFRFRHTRRYLPVGWFWFVGTLIPVIGLVQVGAQAYADRYTYIPYIGLFIIIAWGVSELPLKPSYRGMILGLLSAAALTVCGICAYRQTGFWVNSMTLFSHAIKVTQDNHLAYNNLGSAYNSLGRYQEAVEASQQAIRIKPDYADAYNNLGGAYYGLGRYPEAITTTKHAIELDPNSIKAYYNLGLVCYTLGRCQEAIAAYQRNISNNPEPSAEAYNNLGLAFYQARRYQEALDAYQQAIRIRPDYAKAYNNLGLVYSDLRRYTEAIEAYQQAIHLQPDFAGTYNNLGLTYTEVGSYGEAVAAYKRAIHLQPGYAEAHYDLGLAYFSTGQYTEAVGAFQRAIGLEPNYTNAYNNLGGTYYCLGRYQDAIEAYQRAIHIKPDNIGAYNNLGLACLRLKRYPEAIETFQQAIRLNPDYAAAHYNLGLAYADIGRYAEAIESYRQAIRIKPDYSDAYFDLGLAYLKTGDSASAKEQYNILKTINPAAADKLLNMMNK